VLDRPPIGRRVAMRRARHKRHRERLRASRIVVAVEIDAPVLDLLIRLRWLTESDAHDRGRVGEAIARMLRDSAGA
jgi:hypothetical protein